MILLGQSDNGLIFVLFNTDSSSAKSLHSIIFRSLTDSKKLPQAGCGSRLDDATFILHSIVEKDFMAGTTKSHFLMMQRLLS